MGQAHQGVADETCCEWILRCAKVQHIPNLSRTQVRVMICDQVRHTEKNVRATTCSVFAFVACTTFASV